MAKIDGDGPLPRKIEGFSHYLLPGVDGRIIREESGFSKENLKEHRYRKCGANASEFGGLISLCKKFRDPLDGVFPVVNRRELSNRLTSRMRSLLVLDTLSPFGRRNLDVAFSLEETRQQFVGYDFNLSAPLPYRSRRFILLDRGGRIRFDAASFVSEMDFPAGSEWVAIRLHRYLFDFNSGIGVLCSSECLFLNRFTTLKVASLWCSLAAGEHGVSFTLLEVKFYNFEEGCYVSVVPDLGTIVSILECEK